MADCTFPPPSEDLALAAAWSLPPHRVPTPITREAEARLHGELSAAHSEARHAYVLLELQRELGRRSSVPVGKRGRRG